MNKPTRCIVCHSTGVRAQTKLCRLCKDSEFINTKSCKSGFLGWVKSSILRNLKTVQTSLLPQTQEELENLMRLHLIKGHAQKALKRLLQLEEITPRHRIEACHLYPVNGKNHTVGKLTANNLLLLPSGLNKQLGEVPLLGSEEYIQATRHNIKPKKTYSNSKPTSNEKHIKDLAKIIRHCRKICPASTPDSLYKVLKDEITAIELNSVKQVLELLTEANRPTLKVRNYACKDVDNFAVLSLGIKEAYLVNFEDVAESCSHFTQVWLIDEPDTWE